MHAVCVIYFAAPSHLARLTKHAFPLARPPSLHSCRILRPGCRRTSLHIKCADRRRRGPSVLRAVAITSNRCRPPIHSIYRSDEVLPLPDRHGVAVAVRGDSRAIFLRSAVERVILSRVTFCRFNVSFRPSFRSSFFVSAAEEV